MIALLILGIGLIGSLVILVNGSALTPEEALGIEKILYDGFSAIALMLFNVGIAIVLALPDGRDR